MCEYGSGEKWDNNVVKHCVSIGDACRVPQYGSVHYCGHIGRKIDRGIVEKSLLVPAVGRSAVSNDFMVEESKENEVLSCVMVTDGTRPVASDNPVVKFTDNKQWANPQLYEDIMRTFPRIVEPRKLHELPVFQLLEESRCANVLEKGDSESLFGDMTKKSEKEMETCLLTLEIGGKDLEGCNYKGNVQLSYDNIGPCMAGKFSADAFLDFPVSWEEKGTSYTVRAYARTQSPSVSAYLYVTDDNKQEKRSYFAGTCAEYHSTDIRFTGAEDPGRRIGIRVEKGCLLIQKIEIVENHGSSDEAQRKSLMAPEKWHYFGDVEQKKDGGFLLHNTSALHCEITIHSAAVLHCSVQGRGSLQFGGTKLYIAEGKESLVTIPVDKTRGVDRLCISRIGEEPGELEIKDVYLEILSEEE